MGLFKLSFPKYLVFLCTLWEDHVTNVSPKKIMLTLLILKKKRKKTNGLFFVAASIYHSWKNLSLRLIYYKQLYFLQTWFYNSFAIRASRYFVCKYFIWKKKHTHTHIKGGIRLWRDTMPKKVVSLFQVWEELTERDPTQVVVSKSNNIQLNKYSV